jgi:hypothetical protein
MRFMLCWEKVVPGVIQLAYCAAAVTCSPVGIGATQFAADKSMACRRV